MKDLFPAGLAALSVIALAAAPQAQQTARPTQQAAPAAQSESVITVAGHEFASWSDYANSTLFKVLSLRCGLPPVDPTIERLPPSDCTSGSTTIKPEYSPSNGLIQIPVVVHIIMNNAGTSGVISDAKVASQIKIMNEDFRAIAGSNGGNGNDAMIQFYLADRDPSGNPTTGITRSQNTTWFQDAGGYYNTLAWNTNRYVNIYTNLAGGALGYVPGLPQGGVVGSNADRVVILWSTFGLNGPFGPPYNKGRTVTHELGHYFGLYHTFQSGCAAVSNCYNNGDRICDTNPDGTSHFGCPNSNSCSSPDPVDNYMEYTDDLCMEEFTVEQNNRIRCTIEHYRPNLARAPTACVAASVATRNMSPNPNVYTATTPVIGQNVTFTVDTQGFQFASIYGVANPALRPLDSGGWVLIQIEAPILFSFLAVPGPIAQVSDVVSNDPAMCGITIYTQAKLHNVARRPIVLTNAQDLTFGN
jgi:hypothetical protein